MGRSSRSRSAAWAAPPPAAPPASCTTATGRRGSRSPPASPVRLSPELERNDDLAVPAEVVDLEGRRFPVVRPESLGTEIRHSTGRLLTVDRLILDASEKTELHRESGADLVDMESSAVAALCAERRVRFLALRIVSDDARKDLPREVASLMTQSGSYRIGAALKAIWNRPSSIKDFWTLHEQALEAADRLARFVVRCVGELPA